MGKLPATHLGWLGHPGCRQPQMRRGIEPRFLKHTPAAAIMLCCGEAELLPAIDRQTAAQLRASETETMGAAISGQLTADSETCRLVKCNRRPGGQIHNPCGIQKYTWGHHRLVLIEHLWSRQPWSLPNRYRVYHCS